MVIIHLTDAIKRRMGDHPKRKATKKMSRMLEETP